RRVTFSARGSRTFPRGSTIPRGAFIRFAAPWTIHRRELVRSAGARSTANGRRLGRSGLGVIVMGRFLELWGGRFISARSITGGCIPAWPTRARAEQEQEHLQRTGGMHLETAVLSGTTRAVLSDESMRRIRGDNPSIQVGDRVQYAASFLRSIGAYTGPMGHATGTVTALVPVGSTTLAEIAWDRNRDELPERVNVKNLKKIGSYEANPTSEARELYTWIQNGPNRDRLWRQQGHPIQENLVRKYQKGTYDHTRVPKLWRYFADNA